MNEKRCGLSNDLTPEADVCFAQIAVVPKRRGECIKTNLRPSVIAATIGPVLDPRRGRADSCLGPAGGKRATIRFGGATALQDVSFEVARGAVQLSDPPSARGTRVRSAEMRRDNQDENRPTIRMRMCRRGDDEGRA